MTPWVQGLQGASLASLGICDEGWHTELKWQQRDAQCVSGGQVYQWSRCDCHTLYAYVENHTVRRK